MRRVRTYSTKDVLRLPDPTWQIAGVFPEGGLGVLYGPSGTGKTFVALDMALSVAEGYNWLQRPTKPGAVAYVVGEGRGGLKFRLRAWYEAHEPRLEMPFTWILQPVNFLNEADVKHLINLIRVPPSLLVIDTLARNFGGGDENETKDMNQFIQNVDLLRTELQTGVLVVHHTGKDLTKGARGNSALEGAADVMMMLSTKQRLKCLKQKDAEDFKTIHLDFPIIQLAGESSSRIVTLAEEQGRRGSPSGAPPKNHAENKKRFDAAFGI